MRSTSSSDAQCFLSMTENESDANAGKKHKGQCDLSLSHASSASFFKNNSRDGDGDGADWLVQSAILGKSVDKATFGSDLMKLEQDTKSIRRIALSKEETDFNLLMALEFHDHPKKKSDQLASLLVVVVKRCMDPNFHDKFQVKMINTESHGISTK